MLSCSTVEPLILEHLHIWYCTFNSFTLRVSLTGLSWWGCAGSITQRCVRPSWRSSAASKMRWILLSGKWASSTVKTTSRRTQRSWTWRWRTWRTFLWTLRLPGSLLLLVVPRRRGVQEDARHLPPLNCPPYKAPVLHYWDLSLPPPRAQLSQLWHLQVTPWTSTQDIFWPTGLWWFFGPILTRCNPMHTWTGAERTNGHYRCPSLRPADIRPAPPPFTQGNADLFICHGGMDERSNDSVLLCASRWPLHSWQQGQTFQNLFFKNSTESCLKHLEFGGSNITEEVLPVLPALQSRCRRGSWLAGLGMYLKNIIVFSISASKSNRRALFSWSFQRECCGYPTVYLYKRDSLCRMAKLNFQVTFHKRGSCHLRMPQLDHLDWVHCFISLLTRPFGGRSDGSGGPFFKTCQLYWQIKLFRQFPSCLRLWLTGEISWCGE